MDADPELPWRSFLTALLEGRGTRPTHGTQSEPAEIAHIEAGSDLPPSAAESR